VWLLNVYISHFYVKLIISSSIFIKDDRYDAFSGLIVAAGLETHRAMFIYCKFRKKIQLFCLALVLFWHCGVETCTNFKQDNRIRIRRNGYTELVVGIRDNVEENVDLIERIKESFIEASQLLFNITK
jgi:hypothetical protein